MEIKTLKPRRGVGTLRIDDSDDLVVMEDLGVVPDGKVRLENHGVLFIFTEGRAQFEYDGMVIQIQKNDMLLYMNNSVACNFMASSNLKCRQIWFKNGELWNINLYSKISLADLVYLKQHPKVHLTDEDARLLDSYFQLLCHRMKNPSPTLHPEIVRSLVGTMMLEMLSLMRRDEKPEDEMNIEGLSSTSFHKRVLVNRFIRMVEQSDGRIRKVDAYASQLQITPKYLSTILKEAMNRRPSDLIQLFTMKAIEHRLRFTDMTMQEIANDLNFPNASFFGKYFKEHSGMTPLDFRTKYHRS